PARIAWAPGWPPLRWAWVADADTLRLVEVAPDPGPVPALAFAASGGVAADLAGGRVAGEWTLPAGGGLAVRGRGRLWAAAGGGRPRPGGPGAARARRTARGR